MEQPARKQAQRRRAPLRLRSLQEFQARIGAREHTYNDLWPLLAPQRQDPAEPLCELQISVPYSVRKTA